MIYHELEAQALDGDVLFPGSKAYEKAIFIGNLLYDFRKPACVVMAETDAMVVAEPRSKCSHCL